MKSWRVLAPAPAAICGPARGSFVSGPLFVPSPLGRVNTSLPCCPARDLAIADGRSTGTGPPCSGQGVSRTRSSTLYPSSHCVCGEHTCDLRNQAERFSRRYPIFVPFPGGFRWWYSLGNRWASRLFSFPFVFLIYPESTVRSLQCARSWHPGQ